jgi:enoyl-CoA hydratase/carnithine racemase
MNTNRSNDVVLRDIRDGVAILTLNRPDRLNAWTPAMEARYFGYLEDAAADPVVRAIVVTGAGKGFCAGVDMDALKDIGAGEPSSIRVSPRRFR